jgi:hypothetical protein
MKRMYFVSRNIDRVEHLSEQLYKRIVSGWDFQVLSKDEAGLQKHQIHSANIFERYDLVHSAERGSMIGGFIGLIAILSFARLNLGHLELGIFQYIVVMVAPVLFCTWLGGLIGLHHENYKISRFHDLLEHGAYLVMIDVSLHNEAHVRKIMTEQYADFQPAGISSSITNPFASADRHQFKEKPAH